MKLKTFVIVATGLVAFFALSWMFYANRALLGQSFTVWNNRYIPLYAVIGLAFLVGLGLASVLTLVRESRYFMERWRRQRTRKEKGIPDDLYAKGVEAMLDGLPGQALEHLRAVLARDPNRVEALMKAGEILRSLGRDDEAVELHTRAQRVAPDDLGPLYELVADARTRKDTAACKDYLRQIIQLKPQTALSAYRLLRDLLAQDGKWDKSLEIQEQIEKVRPAGSAEEAADSRTGLGIRYQVGVQMHRTGRTKEATQYLRRLLKSYPTFTPAWRMLGMMRAESRDAEGGVATWQEGYEATKAPVLLTTLEDHFLEAEQPQRAIEVFRKAVSAASPDTLPRFYLGKLFYRLEMLDEALAEFTVLQQRSAYTPTLAYYMAKIHERRNRHGEANAEYRRIIRDQHFLSSQFHCLTCGKQSDAWKERCGSCDEWNTMEVSFREDASLEELGISTAPVYSAQHP